MKFYVFHFLKKIIKFLFSETDRIASAFLIKENLIYIYGVQKHRQEPKQTSGTPATGQETGHVGSLSGGGSVSALPTPREPHKQEQRQQTQTEQQEQKQEQRRRQEQGQDRGTRQRLAQSIFKFCGGGNKQWPM